METRQLPSRGVLRCAEEAKVQVKLQSVMIVSLCRPLNWPRVAHCSRSPCLRMRASLDYGGWWLVVGVA